MVKLLRMAERLPISLPVEKVQDYPELDAMAQQAGLLGIDLLNLPRRVRNAFIRQIPGTLAEAGSLVQVRKLMSESFGRPLRVGSLMAAEVNRRLVELTALSTELVEAKISGILKQRQEREERKRQYKPGEALLGAAQEIFGIGSRLPDGLSVHVLKYGPGSVFYRQRTNPDWDEAAWTQVINSLLPVQKAVVRSALSRALQQSFETVGDIRNAPTEALLRAGGNNSVEFFRIAFGSHK